MNNDTKKYNILHIQSGSALRESQILLAAAFICRYDKTNPLETIKILGLTDDLQKLRTSRRHGRDEVT